MIQTISVRKPSSTTTLLMEIHYLLNNMLRVKWEIVAKIKTVKLRATRRIAVV